MKKEDIYIGTIKKCNDWYNYTTRGEKYVTDNKQFNTVEVIENNAVLIKIGETEFIPLKSLNTFVDDILIDLGKKIAVIYIEPEFNNNLFVDKETIVPYYSNNLEEKIKIKTLRKDINNKRP